jgi:hypothetical protein
MIGHDPFVAPSTIHRRPCQVPIIPGLIHTVHIEQTTTLNIAFAAFEVELTLSSSSSSHPQHNQPMSSHDDVTPMSSPQPCRFCGCGVTARSTSSSSHGEGVTVAVCDAPACRERKERGCRRSAPHTTA